MIVQIIMIYINTKFFHHKIKIIKNKKLRPAFCRNIGAKESKYETLIFLILTQNVMQHN